MDTNKIIELVKNRFKNRKVINIYEGNHFYFIKTDNLLDSWVKIDKNDEFIVPINLNRDMGLINKVLSTKPIYGEETNNIIGGKS